MSSPLPHLVVAILPTASAIVIVAVVIVVAIVVIVIVIIAYYPPVGGVQFLYSSLFVDTSSVDRAGTPHPSSK